MAFLEFVFCPRCATRLEARRTVDDRARPTCPACGFVHFRDPKVAVIAFVTALDAGGSEHVLLTRRAVDPERGKWALPGGYMDAGETPQGALARELSEEVDLAIDVGALIELLAMPGEPPPGIVLAFRATAQAHSAMGDLPALASNDDVAEAGWFRADALPGPLAFASTVQLLDAWRAGACAQTTDDRPLTTA